MNILLTGGTGYLGGKILEYLLASVSCAITLVVRPTTIIGGSIIGDNRITFVTYRNGSLEFSSRKHFDLVIHCATNYGRGAKDPFDIIEANLLLPLRLLDLSKVNGWGCFINTDTMLDKGVSSYSLSKRQFNDWLVAYSGYVNCINISLEHFYGPGDDDTKFVSHIVRSLIQEVDSIALTKGEQKRDFIYINDVVSAFAHIIEGVGRKSSGYINYDVGVGVSIPVRRMVNLAKEISGNKKTKLDYGEIPYRTNEMMDVHCDLKNLRNLGWGPKYTLEEGLREMIQCERGLMCDI